MKGMTEQIEISGEPFYVEREDGVVWIRHTQWSLLGHGPTLEDARLSLIEECYSTESALVSMQTIGGAKLSPQAERMLAFCKNIDPNAALNSPARRAAAAE